MRVPARPAQHVHRRVPDLRRRTRRSASTIGGGTPDMTIGCAAADRAGACAGSVSLPAPAAERLASSSHTPTRRHVLMLPLDSLQRRSKVSYDSSADAAPEGRLACSASLLSCRLRPMAVA